MTKWQLTRPGGPWEYDRLGFSAVNGAILDGALSTPVLTTAPDAFWAVYTGPNPETGVTRYGGGSVVPPPEPSDGFILSYSDPDNAYVPTDPGAFVAKPAVDAALQAKADAATGAVLDAELDERTATVLGDDSSESRQVLSDVVDAEVTPVAARVATIGTHLAAAEELLRRGGGAPPSTGQTIVIFGDSIVSQNAQQYNTVGGIGGVRAYNNQGWFSHAQVMLGHRLKLLKNSGISGENTTQWLARINADLLSLNPNFVAIGGPTNDATGIANGARTLAETKANLTSIWDQATTAKIVIIQGLITPWDSSNVTPDPAARRKAVFEINQYIREQGRLRGFTVVDFYTPLSSGVASDWKAGSYSPGDTSKLHPNGQGAYNMGRQFAAAVAPITNPVDLLPPSNAETANLVNSVHANGSALALGSGGVVGAGGSGVIATGRRCDPLAASVFACSQVARTDGVPGVWDQIKLTSGWIKYGVNVTGYGTTYTENDEVYALAEFETDGDLSAGSGASNFCLLNLVAMRPDFGVGRQGYDLAVSAADVFQGGAHFPVKGVFMTPLVVVPSTATLRLALQVELRGSGTLRVGRLGIYKKGTGPGADAWARSDANAS